MTKKDLIILIAQSQGLQQSKAAAIVDKIFDTISSILANGNSISIKNFGVFSVINKAERNVINPRTGEKMIVPAYKSVHFSSFKKLKETINNAD